MVPTVQGGEDVSKHWRTALTSILVLGFVGCGGGDTTQESEAAEAAPPDPTPTVVMETSMGTVVMELDRERAPLTVDNFERHVRLGFYDGLIFHRVMVGWMIQGGAYTPEMARLRTSARPIRNESDNGLPNVRGSVAMARTLEPHSATTQFFINVVDRPNQDYNEANDIPWGYAVFGRVSEGMEVVDEISRVPVRRRGSHEAVPVEPVVINRMFIRE
jgi:cyclophilin family peptidyl-prolyl cis-trans isomerase